jgi:hypothetical protein
MVRVVVGRRGARTRCEDAGVLNDLGGRKRRGEDIFLTADDGLMCLREWMGRR